MGFKLPQIYWNVLLPQAYRIIIPPLTSEFLNVFKNSSVASLIGLMELLAQTKQTAEFSANLFEAFTLATLIYFTLNMSLMLLMRMVEKKVAVPGLISVGVNNGIRFQRHHPRHPGLWNGMVMTLQLMVMGVVGGIVLGTILALMRLSSNKLLSRLAGAYQLLPLDPAAAGDHLVLPGGAVRAALDHRRRHPDRRVHLLRRGLHDVRGRVLLRNRPGRRAVDPQGPDGRRQAMGMTYGQTMRLIILPQAFRKMTPLLLQQSIILFQDTSLVYTVGLVDFLNSARSNGDIIGRSNEFLIFAGVVYFIISFSASLLVKRLQKGLPYDLYQEHQQVVWRLPGADRLQHRGQKRRSDGVCGPARASPP
jgi:glutamate/aspartate transport system permease protein